MAALEDSSSRAPSSSFPQHGGSLSIATAAPVTTARDSHVLSEGKPRAVSTTSNSNMADRQLLIATSGELGKANSKSVAASRSHIVRGVEGGSLPTRSSQRQIKRPKTDDELIDFDGSSRNKKHRSIGGGASSKGTPLQHQVSKGGSVKKPARLRLSSATKDLGRWRPTDDLMLISAVLQTNDLAAVHLGVKFSCRFTLREVEERWYALLYEPQISKLAVEAIRGVHPGVVTMALNNSLWSQEEEALLNRIPSTDPGHLETFQRLLAEHPAVFNQCRTATSLHHHWVLMGHYCLLHDQNVDVIPPGDSVVNFTDAEDLINDADLMKSRDVKDEALEQELIAADRRAKQQILQLEQELPVWRTALELKTCPVFEPGVFAILKGRVVQFMMRSREVTIGRSSASSQVTFDLSLEGPAYKISRKQATIRLGSDGVFRVYNDGRRPLYLSGRAVCTGESALLQHNQTMEVASMSFIIYLNSHSPPSLNY